jgi:hypothetical protein
MLLLIASKASVLNVATPSQSCCVKERMNKHYERTAKSAATIPRPAPVTSKDIHTFPLKSSFGGNSTQSCSCNIKAQELLYTHYIK